MNKYDYDYLISIPGVWEIGDRHAYAKGRHSTRQDQEDASQVRTKFFQVIKILIESEFTDGVQSIPVFDVTETGVMFGQFKEASARRQLYDFTITVDDKLRYNEANFIRQDSIAFPRYIFREDATKSNNCTKGKRCGKSCVEKGLECVRPLADRFKKHLPAIRKTAIAIKNNKLKTALVLIAGYYALKTPLKVASMISQSPEFIKNTKIADSIKNQKQTISESKLEGIVNSEENKIKDLDHERMVIVNPKDGTVLAKAIGKKSAVSLPFGKVPLMKGAIVTHNHPYFSSDNIKTMGISFSPPDFREACNNEVAEMRAVSAGYRHSLKPPKTGWNRDYYNQKAKPVYEKNWEKHLSQLREKVRKGQMRGSEADALLCHLVIKDTAKELGLKYTRTTIPGVTPEKLAKSRKKGQQSTRQDAVPTKENLFQIIKQLIESCFTDGIRSIPAFDILPNKMMFGQFKEKSARGQLYKFTVTPDGEFRYNEADAIRAESFSFPYWSFREDKQSSSRTQPQCKKGKRCKGSCIERGRECIVDLPPKFKQQLPQIQKMAIAVKSSIGESNFSTIEDAEAKIKDLPYEAAVIIDPKTNKVLLEKKGQRDRIGFTEDEVKQVKGAVFTHNHPDLDFPPDTLAWQGAPFSTADIAFGAINETAEIRTVGHLYSYSMKPPTKGWNKAFYEEKIVDSYNKHAMQQYGSLVNDIRSGRTDAQSAQLEYMHRVTTEMSKELGIKYERSKVPNVDEAKLKQEYRSRMRKKKLSKLAIAGALVAASVWAESQLANQPVKQ